MALNWFKKTKAPAGDREKDVQSANKPDPQPSDENSQDHESEETITNKKQPTTEIDSPSTHISDQPEQSLSKTNQSPPEISPNKRRGRLMERLKTGLTKTRNILTTDIDALFRNKKNIDDDMLEELEELLITSDIGVQTTMELMQKISRQTSKIASPQALKETLKQELLSLLKDVQTVPTQNRGIPHVVMVVGVNGVGKTTTIGKLASRATQRGESVLIAAADTFRAAAIEQLTIWAERSNAQIVKHKADADPAAVVFDSMEAAIARKMDTVFVDTAGRLHTKINLMEELKKIQRTITKKLPGAPNEVLLVLDATTGQNALSQAKMFHEAIGVSGIALTKLDGTAKGGIVISISQTLNIPLQYIGVGEGIEDLQSFNPEQFADALF